MTNEEAREAVREAYDYGDPEYANEIIKALERQPICKERYETLIETGEFDFIKDMSKEQFWKLAFFIFYVYGNEGESKEKAHRNIESIPYLMHKEMDIPISECQKAYDVAIDYLRKQGKVKG